MSELGAEKVQRVFGYLRVSSDEQDVNSQKQGVDSYAESQNWEIDEYIIDNGVSGGVDYAKRHLGELLNDLREGDVIICSEISRLGRNLFMVMEILNKVMKSKAVIHTVKDGYKMGDDIQSKVLAFAFGLAAEIERQLIQQRTAEGLALKRKMGVLLGRPPREDMNSINNLKHVEEKKETIITLYNLGVSIREIQRVTKINRNTITRNLIFWRVHNDWEKLIDDTQKQWEENLKKRRLPNSECYIDKDKLRVLIESNMTIPEIAKTFPMHKYNDVYHAIHRDRELNLLYRKHGQKRVSSRASAEAKKIEKLWAKERI